MSLNMPFKIFVSTDDPVERALWLRGAVLSLVMFSALVITISATLVLLYNTAFNEQRQRLLEIVHSHARLIEAVAKFDQQQSSDYPGGATNATLTQVKQALTHWIGGNEITLAQSKGDHIQFIVQQRAANQHEPDSIDFNSTLAEPMRRALLGQSGTLIGTDYRGEAVLAAYEPVAILNLGIVTKIDIKEIRAPFINAGIMAGFIGTILFILTNIAFFFLGNPVVRHALEQERWFRTIFEQAGVGFALINIQTGHIAKVNQRICAMLGFADNCSLPQLNNILHPDDYPKIANVIEKIQHGETRELNLECRCIHSDGHIIDTDLIISPTWNLEIKPDYYIAVLKDITEQKQAQKELHQTHEILQAAMDHSPAGIAIADAPDGKLRYVNKAGLFIRGANHENAVYDVTMDQYAAKWQILDLDKTPLPTDEIPLTRAIRFGEICSREFIVRRGKDDDRIVQANAAPIKNAAGEVVCAIVIFTDMTQHQALEKKLNRIQKLEAIGQLTGGIAHDFNNILAIVLGNLELLEIQPDHNEKSQGYIETAIEAAKRGAELTQRLLAFSRKQPLAPQNIDINDLIHTISKMLQRILGETIAVRGYLEPDIWCVLADRSQLEHALINLAVNARDAMPNGGFLTIESKNVVLDTHTAKIREEVISGEYVSLSISDNGHGMAPEIQERVFEPFFTTKEVGKGSGLGLSMVYGFAKQSKGHVAIYSELGRGTTVRLYLPRSVAADTKPTNSAIVTIPKFALDKPKNLRILVVEDDLNVQKTTVATLRQYNYQVIAASDATDALEQLKNDNSIDLLFTDIVLPGSMNGVELAREAQRQSPKLKVLYTTGYSEKALLHQGQLQDGVAILLKPFYQEELISTIQMMYRTML